MSVPVFAPRKLKMRISTCIPRERVIPRLETALQVVGELATAGRMAEAHRQARMRGLRTLPGNRIRIVTEQVHFAPGAIRDMRFRMNLPHTLAPQLGGRITRSTVIGRRRVLQIELPMDRLLEFARVVDRDVRLIRAPRRPFSITGSPRLPIDDEGKYRILPVPDLFQEDNVPGGYTLPGEEFYRRDIAPFDDPRFTAPPAEGFYRRDIYMHHDVEARIRRIDRALARGDWGVEFPGMTQGELVAWRQELIAREQPPQSGLTRVAEGLGVSTTVVIVGGLALLAGGYLLYKRKG